jgi:hypothetical protein
MRSVRASPASRSGWWAGSEASGYPPPYPGRKFVILFSLRDGCVAKFVQIKGLAADSSKQSG